MEICAAPHDRVAVLGPAPHLTTGVAVLGPVPHLTARAAVLGLVPHLTTRVTVLGLVPHLTTRVAVIGTTSNYVLLSVIDSMPHGNATPLISLPSCSADLSVPLALEMAAYSESYTVDDGAIAKQMLDLQGAVSKFKRERSDLLGDKQRLLNRTELAETRASVAETALEELQKSFQEQGSQLSKYQDRYLEPSSPTYEDEDEEAPPLLRNQFEDGKLCYMPHMDMVESMSIKAHAIDMSSGSIGQQISRDALRGGTIQRSGGLYPMTVGNVATSRPDGFWRSESQDDTLVSFFDQVLYRLLHGKNFTQAIQFIKIVMPRVAGAVRNYNLRGVPPINLVFYTENNEDENELLEYVPIPHPSASLTPFATCAAYSERSRTSSVPWLHSAACVFGSTKRCLRSEMGPKAKARGRRAKAPKEKPARGVTPDATRPSNMAVARLSAAAARAETAVINTAITATTRRVTTATTMAIMLPGKDTPPTASAVVPVGKTTSATNAVLTTAAALVARVVLARAPPSQAKGTLATNSERTHRHSSRAHADLPPPDSIYSLVARATPSLGVPNRAEAALATDSERTLPATAAGKMWTPSQRIQFTCRRPTGGRPVRPLWHPTKLGEAVKIDTGAARALAQRP